MIVEMNGPDLESFVLAGVALGGQAIPLAAYLQNMERRLMAHQAEVGKIIGATLIGFERLSEEVAMTIVQELSRRIDALTEPL